MEIPQKLLFLFFTLWSSLTADLPSVTVSHSLLGAYLGEETRWPAPSPLLLIILEIFYDKNTVKHFWEHRCFFLDTFPPELPVTPPPPPLSFQNVLIQPSLVVCDSQPKVILKFGAHIGSYSSYV